MLDERILVGPIKSSGNTIDPPIVIVDPQVSSNKGDGHKPLNRFLNRSSNSVAGAGTSTIGADQAIQQSLPKVLINDPVLEIDLRHARPSLTLLKGTGPFQTNKLKLDTVGATDIASVRLVPGKKVQIAVVLPTDIDGQTVDKANLSVVVQTRPAVSAQASTIATLQLNSSNATEVVVNGNTVAYVVNVMDDSLVVPATGSIYCYISKNFTTQTRSDPDTTTIPGSAVSISGSEPWKFDNAFSTLGVLPQGQSWQFGVAVPVATFGNNASIRLDAVALFPINGTTDKGGVKLGQALSYSFYLGQSTHETGHQVFGFPMRLSFSLGYKDLDFGAHSYPNVPFIGFGISIPMGGP